jgi:uncharacterized protein
VKITTDELREAGRLANTLHRQSRELLVDSVRRAARDGFSQREIAAALGRSQPEVSRLLRFAPTSDRGKVLARQRGAVLALARKHGLSNVRVFGSVARGTDTPGSDVDLLVDPGTDTGLFDLARFQIAVSKLLDVPADVVPASSLNPRFATRVLEEAVPL